MSLRKIYLEIDVKNDFSRIGYIDQRAGRNWLEIGSLGIWWANWTIVLEVDRVRVLYS